jgi:uncharacterized membrane protein YqiK
VSEIVNLRQARKRKARADADKTAAERRAAYGRPKAEKQAEALRREIEGRALDGHRRDDP